MTDTKKKPSEMTKQELFDTCIGGVIKQGSLSYNDKKHKCMFMSPQGNMCAIAFLAPSVNDAKDWENDQWTNEEIYDYLDVISMRNFLNKVQRIHDGVAEEVNSIEDFIIKAKEFADKNDLDDTYISQLS